jgi:cyclophilin family peptidyl-prolyl cis-trans isomerase
MIPMNAFLKRTAGMILAFQMVGLIGVCGADTVTPSPIVVSTFQVNNGEMIVRSRTVTLTIAATSSKGSIRGMQLGDSVRALFGPLKAFSKTVIYSFPETATGRQVIAGVFLDSKNNWSNQVKVVVDIMPDLPVQPALMTGSILPQWLRRGNYSLLQLPDAVHDPGKPIVQFSTSMGEILMQLEPVKAPDTVKNFLTYVDNNNYDNSFFHRSVQKLNPPEKPIPFIIQGGNSFIVTANNTNSVTPIESHGIVKNEPGDSNLRGTIAMAKVDGLPNSATSEWFFNMSDNTDLDTQNGGFTVFGNVLAPSMRAVNDIAALPVSNQSESIGFNELPLIQVPKPGESLVLSDLVMIGAASRFRFSVIKQPVGVKATILNNFLVLESDGKPTHAKASVMMRAVAPDGRYLNFAVPVDIATDHPMLAKGVGTLSVTTKEDTPIDIPIAVGNPDNSPLEWTLTVVPTLGNCELLPESKQGLRTIRYTPKGNVSGSDTFTIQVLDKDNVNSQKSGMDQLKVNLTISPVNDLPTITAPATFAMSGGTTSSFDVTVADVETPAANLVVTCSASGSVFPKGSVTMEGSGGHRTVRLSASATTKLVKQTFTLTVTDGDKKSTTAKVAVTVSP